MPRKLLMTACDTGSANFLLPVLPVVGTPYALFAQGPAADLFERRGVAHTRLPRVDWDGLEGLGAEVLSSGDYAAVLTGTSWGPTVDKAATLAGRARGLPTASVVEHWDLYRERFSRVEDGRIAVPDAYLPGSVWLPDARAAREAAEAGLPAGRLRAVGQPHLEAQSALLREGPPVPRTRDVVFVSERVAGDFHRGFTEHDALDALTAALDFGRHRLVIKLHPQEEDGKYAGLAARGVEARVVRQCDMRALLLGAHRVVGMFSMLLLEAALVRRDVISLLPGGDPAVFVGNRIGATVPARSAAELRALLADDAPAPGTSAFGDAFRGSRDAVAAQVRSLAS